MQDFVSQNGLMALYGPFSPLLQDNRCRHHFELCLPQRPFLYSPSEFFPIGRGSSGYCNN